MRTPAAAAIVLQTAGAGAQTADIHGTWTAELRNNKVFLQVQAPQPDDWNRNNDWRGGWNMGQSFPVDELSGLPGNDERFTAASVKFELRREGGTLGFEGSFRDGRGAGLFTFAPRREYIAEMRRLGYNDDIPLWRQFQLTVHDVGPRYIAALKAEGYDKLSLDQIQRSKNHGVTIDYIKAMKAEGFKAATLEELVRTRDHGVSADYLADMKSLLKDLSLTQVVRMRDHGVTPGFINHARARGFTTTDPEELVRLKDRGLWKN